MWRSNVLRCGHCLHAARPKHVATTFRRTNSTKSEPVGNDEFMRAMRAGVLKQDPDDFVAKNRLGGVGIAISGGVDSMALAALYVQAQTMTLAASHTKSQPEKLPHAHGLIVDHGLRPESTEEANWVKEQLLSKLGIRSTILTLTWPDALDRNGLKRFETDARTLRYQALGRACVEMKISRLMLAHHADDQAETVMMRLANNRLRSGLQAMQHKEWIPECEGMYGAYHSGRYRKPGRATLIPFHVEQGGIQIFRPLLTFEKTRLIATCEEKGVPWSEDKTNQIKTLTSRNAIRHIYKNHKLPEALSVKSLVDVSQHMQERIQWHKMLANDLFDKCLIKLDIQTGSLVVRFPPFSDLLPRPISTKADKAQAKNTAYCLIERVAELVTPRSKAPLGQLAATVCHIYPELEDLEEDEEPGHGDEVRKKNYCVYSVWWRFWDRPSLFDEHMYRPAGMAPPLPHPREWLLTRQPLETAEAADVDNHIVYPPMTSTHEPYRLFDGRYWIKMLNRLTKDTLHLRIFTKDDIHHLPTIEQNKAEIQEDALRPWRYILTAFNHIKPADLRFTLPAVFRKHWRTGDESLVGFPTLDLRTHGFGPPLEVCFWDVRYKKIDSGSRKVEDLILPGISKEDIMAEELEARLAQGGVSKPPKTIRSEKELRRREKLKKRRRMKMEKRKRQEEMSIDASTESKRAGRVDERNVREREWRSATEDVQESMRIEETGALSSVRKPSTR